MKKFFLIGCVLVPLCGCFKNEGISSAENVLSRDWANVDKEDIEDEPQIYCYRTIGYTECYREPIPRLASRLISTHPPKNPNQKGNPSISYRFDEVIIEPIEKVTPPKAPPSQAPINIR